MKEFVLVVTPTFCTPENQRLPLLLQSIYWVQQQSRPGTIHAVVDDGSTDQTPEILENLARHLPFLRVYHQSNRGSSSAINFGVERALSEFNPGFITIGHSDDLLFPESLEDRVELAGQTSSPMVYSDLVVFYEDGSNPRLHQAREFEDSQTLFDGILAKGYPVPYPTLLWERDFFTDKVGGFDDRITSAEDWDITLRTARALCETGQESSCLNRTTVAYRVHENQLGPQNRKDGTKWQCYKMIVAKNLAGKDAQLFLARLGLNMARSYIPEPIKKPLRVIRDLMLSPHSPIFPYRSEFIEEVKTIDYERELSIPS